MAICISKLIDSHNYNLMLILKNHEYKISLQLTTLFMLKMQTFLIEVKQFNNASVIFYSNDKKIKFSFNKNLLIIRTDKVRLRLNMSSTAICRIFSI